MRERTARIARSLAFGSLLLLAAPAAAADATAVADELVAMLTGGTRVAVYETATAVGEVVTITGFAFDDPPNGTRGAVAEIVVTNPVPREEGGFIAETILLTNGELTDDANVLRFAEVELHGVVVPPETGDENDPSIPLTAMIATGIAFVPPQANPLLIERVELTLGQVAEGVPYAIAAAVTGVEVPLTMADNTQAVDILRDLGFEALSLSFNIAGNFDADNDTLTIESLGIAIRDFGHIDMAATITGIALGRLTEPGGVDIVLGQALVNNVSVRFDNQGAMEAFLQTQAAMVGMAPADVAFGLATAMQLYLAVLEDPALERQIGTAVGAFLRDPRSITLVATPAEPVFLTEILGLIVTAPMTLPGLLGVVLTANQDPPPAAPATPTPGAPAAATPTTAPAPAVPAPAP